MGGRFSCMELPEDDPASAINVDALGGQRHDATGRHLDLLLRLAQVGGREQMDHQATVNWL